MRAAEKSIGSSVSGGRSKRTNHQQPRRSRRELIQTVIEPMLASGASYREVATTANRRGFTNAKGKPVSRKMVQHIALALRAKSLPPAVTADPVKPEESSTEAYLIFIVVGAVMTLIAFLVASGNL